MLNQDPDSEEVELYRFITGAMPVGTATNSQYRSYNLLQELLTLASWNCPHTQFQEIEYQPKSDYGLITGFISRKALDYVIQALSTIDFDLPYPISLYCDEQLYVVGAPGGRELVSIALDEYQQ